jgi:hypothetical protein
MMLGCFFGLCMRRPKVSEPDPWVVNVQARCQAVTAQFAALAEQERLACEIHNFARELHEAKHRMAHERDDFVGTQAEVMNMLHQVEQALQQQQQQLQRRRLDNNVYTVQANSLYQQQQR